jgi:dTDP-4-amino-4,6-dideoxygalactose transaminase
LSDLLVDEEIVAAAQRTLESGWWSMGPRVAEFEEAFAAFIGTKHALAVSSGTAALHIGLLATESTGGEIVLPSLNFVAAANAVVHAGGTPVFCDVLGADDLNLDPEDLEAAVSARTKAVIVLHYAGFSCDLDAVLEVAERNRLVVIEDAAHAPGARWREGSCGAIGQVGCFSFFSNKNLPIGEGGMLVTDDDVIAQRARLIRSHGMTTLTWDRHRGHAGAYDVMVSGFNYRLDEVRASIGLLQLARLRAANDSRARLAQLYREQLSTVPSLTIPFGTPDPRATPADHLFVVLLPEGVEREPVRAALQSRGIQTSVHYPPIHRFSAFAHLPTRPLPRTEALAERLLTLPLFPHMTDEQVTIVVDALATSVP